MNNSQNTIARYLLAAMAVSDNPVAVIGADRLNKGDQLGDAYEGMRWRL